ncbi:MAG: DUF5522 domain-containing protein [Tepidisphaeraceae bacterium]
MPPADQSRDRPLVEGRDYRIDTRGNLVFTARYLRERGDCCGNKCRNCPFGWRNVPTSRRVAGEPQPPLDGE